MATKGKLALGIGLVIAVLCGLGGFAFFRYFDYPFAASDLPKAIQQAKQAGIPLTADELDPPSPADEQVGAEVVLSSLPMSAVNKKSADLHAQMKAGTVDWSAELVRARGNSRVIQDLDKLSKQPRLGPRKDYDEGVNMLLPELAQVKAGVKLLCDDAVIKAYNHDHKAALLDLQIAQRLSDKCHPLLLIGYLVDIALDAITMRATEDCLAAAHRDPRALVMYGDWLKANQPVYDFKRALRMEAYMAVATVRNLDLIGGIKALAGARGFVPPTSKLRRSGVPPGIIERAYMTRVLQYWTQAFDNAGRFKDSAAYGAYLDQIAEREGDIQKGMSRIIVPLVTPEYKEAALASTQSQAKHLCVLALAQVLQYRAVHGQYPATLQQAGVTASDPFDHAPLKFRIEGNSVRVWSVGKDLKDDNGLDLGERDSSSGQGVDVVAMYPPLRKKRPT